MDGWMDKQQADLVSNSVRVSIPLYGGKTEAQFEDQLAFYQSIYILPLYMVKICV